MTPRATVGVAFHDEEHHLAAAVRSVLAQSERDLEVLLVDDGSTDGSLRVARELARDPRVRLLPGDGRRRHLGARLNQLVSAARAGVFVRMDADDVSHPERVRRQVEHLDRHPSCDAVGSWAALVDDAEVPFATLESDPAGARGAALLERAPIAHATMTARTGWLRALRYDEALPRAEDRDLWCRARGARIDVVPDVLYVIRILTRRRDFLADYLGGQADLRRVVRRHGVELAGPLATARVLGASVLKGGAMRGAVALGLEAALVRRRGRAPTEAEIARVREAFAAAQPP